MTNDFQLVFHNIEPSAAITQAVEKRVEKLGRYCDHILTGRVVLNSPHNHHHKGKVYSVNLEVHLPGKDLRVDQEKHDHSHAHEDLYIAIRDAFDTAERQLRAINKKHRTTPLHKEPEAVMAEADDAAEAVAAEVDDATEAVMAEAEVATEAVVAEAEVATEAVAAEAEVATGAGEAEPEVAAKAA